MRADADFPGGNAIVESCADGELALRPDLRDTGGDWFYWCVRVRGAAGSRLRVRLTRPGSFAARGPGLSSDGGDTWRWLGAVVGDAFTVEVPEDCDDLRLSMGMPYVPERLDRFLAPFGPRIRRSVLCRSRKGRDVPLLGMGHVGAPRRVLVTARHHACEMMASYAVEGMIAAALAGDDVGRWFGERVELVVAPFVDRDGVEDGDQGKNRSPRDHNRDYSGESLYPETAALRARIPAWGAAGIDAVLDLHCPWIVGGRNESAFQVGAKSEAAWREQRAFASALAALGGAALPYDPGDDLPFGQEWNVDHAYDAGEHSSAWFGSLPGVRLSTTIELPYALARGAVVDQRSARGFGDDLARALRAYLG